MAYFKGAIIAPHPPIIIPAVGEGRERKANNTIGGMKELAKIVQKIRPEVIVCITPHGTTFDDGICISDEQRISGDLSRYGAGKVSITKEIHKELNQSFCGLLEELDFSHIAMSVPLSKSFGVSVELDHGCIVPLYYIDEVYKDYKILHISIGYTSIIEHYEIGMALRTAIERLKIKSMILASGDLSHAISDTGPYSYNENGPKFDKEIVGSLEKGDFASILSMDSNMVNKAATCSYRPFAMMMGAFDSWLVESKIFSYEAPFGVGYATGFIDLKEEKRESQMEIYLSWLKKEQSRRLLKEDQYIRLAREAIYTWITSERMLNIEEYFKAIQSKYTVKQKLLNFSPEAFIKEVTDTRAGCFVSLHKDGQLRGCIGTILPTASNLAEEIVYNAISACSKDNRFVPVAIKELPFLEISVDVLSEPSEVSDISELDPNEYGVIVSTGQKHGVLLPRLEQVKTVEQQLMIARKKAGINDNEKYTIQKFTVYRHEVNCE